MNGQIENIIKISTFFGNNPCTVQGGGGNTSIKTSDTEMLIKPSGSLLKNLKNKSDFTPVNIVEVNNLLTNNNISEADFTRGIKKSNLEPSLPPPSIETGFHSFLKKYVVHIHCSYSNIVNCSLKGWTEFQKQRPDICFVPYATPGKELSFQVYKEFSSKPNSKIFFLQNHGIIIHSNDHDEIYRIYSELIDSLFNAFNIITFDTNKVINTNKKESISILNKALNYYLFPDQVIYINKQNFQDNNFNGPEKLYHGSMETLNSYSYIINEIERLDLFPNFLSSAQLAQITETSGEKNRIKEMTK